MTTPARPTTWRVLLPLLPVGAALFSIQLDFFALRLALPPIAADLGTTSTDSCWSAAT